MKAVFLILIAFCFALPAAMAQTTVFEETFPATSSGWRTKPETGTGIWHIADTYVSTNPLALMCTVSEDSGYYALPKEGYENFTLTSNRTYRVSVRCSLATNAGTKQIVLGIAPNINLARRLTANVVLQTGALSTNGWNTFTTNFNTTGDFSSWTQAIPVLWAEVLTTPRTAEVFVDDIKVELLSNLLPSAVSITSPTGWEVVNSPATIQATASDPDNNIERVKFYSGTTYLGEDLTSPYSLLANLSPGTRSVKAVAIDQYGLSLESASRTFVVNTPPTATSSSPADGAQYNNTGSVSLSATAWDDDFNITKVEFFVNGQLVGDDNSIPYSYSYSNSAGGHFTWHARAVDDLGLWGLSDDRGFDIAAPPSTSIISPLSHGTVGSCNVYIQAETNLGAGGILAMKFFRDDTLIGTDSISPYEYQASGWAAGTYLIEARGVDMNGIDIAGAQIYINVEAADLVLDLTESNQDCKHRIFGTVSSNQSLTLSSLANATDADDNPFTGLEIINGEKSKEWEQILKFSDYSPVGLGYTLTNAYGCSISGTFQLHPETTVAPGIESELVLISGLKLDPNTGEYYYCEPDAANLVIQPVVANTTGTFWYQALNPADNSQIYQTFTNTNGTVQITSPMLEEQQLVLNAITPLGCTGGHPLTINFSSRQAPTVTVAPVTVYGNEPALAVAQASGGTGTYSYNWSTGTCLDSSRCDSVMLADFTNPVTVSVVDGNGCGDVDTVSVTHCHSIALSNSGANYSDISPGSELYTQYQAICAGNSVQLNAHTSSGFEGALSWFKNGNLIDGYISDSLIESPDSATIYKVSIPSTSTCESRYAQINVKVINTQTNFTFDSLHCHAHLIDSLAPTFSASLLSPGATQGTTQFSQGSLVSYSPTYTTTGRYNLSYIVTDGNYGCSTTNYLHANWSDFKVQVPPVYVNHALTSYGIAVGSLGQPFANPDKYKYEWFKNGIHYADGQQMSAPDTLGPYYAIGTDSLGCNASDTLTYVYRDMYSTRSIWAKNQTYTSATIHWDDKTSVKHFVVIREGKRTSFIPEQGKGYSSDPEFGMASLGSGHFGLFNGEGGSVEITGLAPNKKYYVSAFAWKIVDGDTLWDTTHVQYQLKPTAIPTPKGLEIPAITGHSVTLKWAKKDGHGVILAGKQGNEITASPKDSIVYPDSLLFNASYGFLSDGSKVLFNGDLEDSVIVGGLDSNQIYSFKVWYFKTINTNRYFGLNGSSGTIISNLAAPDSIGITPDSSVYSAHIHLTGVNLIGTDQIMIGEKKCSFKVLSNKLVDIKVPTGTGTNTVKIRKNNEWLYCQNQFNYLSIPEQEIDNSFSCGESSHRSPLAINTHDPIEPFDSDIGKSFIPHGDITILVMNIVTNSNSESTNPFSIWPDPNLPPINLEEAFYDDQDLFSPESAEDDFTLSNFYFQMSKNSSVEPLRMRFFVLPFTVTVANAQASLSSYFSSNPQILDILDTRRNNPSYASSPNDFVPDQKFDFVIQLVRNTGPVSSASNLTSPTVTSVSAGGTRVLTMPNGVQIHGMMGRRWNRIKGIITHEISHTLFDSPHVFFNNDVTGPHYTTTSGWGTMVVNGNAGLGFNFLANPWESWLLGWKNAITITNQSNSGNFQVADFTHTNLSSTSSDIFRIRIPNTNQSLWLTNHSGVSNLDRGEQLVDPWSLPVTPSKGIYMMVEDMGLLDRSLDFQPDFASPGALKTLHREGGIELLDYNYQVRSNPPYGQDTWRWCPNTVLKRKSPFSLYNKTSALRLKSPYRSNFEVFNFSDNGASVGPTYAGNELVFQRFEGEVEKPGYALIDNAFGSTNEIDHLGINFATPVFNHQRFYVSNQDFDPIILNGIEIAIPPITGGAQNQDRTFSVKYDANHLTTNQLFTGFFNLTDLPDLNPDLVINTEVVLTLDKPLNPNRTNKGENNLFPDFITPSRFICKTGSILRVNEGATITVENESGFSVESGAEVQLGKGARIIVRSGGTFHIHSNAKITGDLGSLIILEDHSYYCISSNATIIAVNNDLFRLGINDGATSPKFLNGSLAYKYLPTPSSCVQSTSVALTFNCNQVSASSGTVNTFNFINEITGTTYQNSSPNFNISGKEDGKYLVQLPFSGTTLPGKVQSSFELWGNSSSTVTFTSNHSFSNIVVFNSSISATAGKLSFEPQTQVYILGTPVTSSPVVHSVSGGDINISGSANLDIRDGATFQGMCNKMWGGIHLLEQAGMTAYNNMHFEDSYDGIVTGYDGGTENLIQLHVFNGKFRNNYNSVTIGNSEKAFNFVRNSSFESSPTEMKAPFVISSCNKYISKNHVTFSGSKVNFGNFWNNSLKMAQTGLKVLNQTKNFNSVSNRYELNYGKSIDLVDCEGDPMLFDRETIQVPSGEIFCEASPGDGTPGYIPSGGNFSKVGIYSATPNNFRLRDVSISGSGPATPTANTSGLYVHGGYQADIQRTILQDLKYGIVWIGDEDDNDGLNSVLENQFSNNGTNLLFKNSYQAGYKLTLKCNRFTTPTSPAPFTTRYGIYVEAGAGMPDIGGNLSFSNPNTPSGNWWPSVGTSNSTVSPWEAPNGAGLNSNNTNVVYWQAPSGWESVHNLAENTWSYFRYTNEFLGPFYNPNNIPYFDPTIVQRLILSRVNIPIPNTNPVQFYPNQQIPSGWSTSDYDVACSFFAANLVFPTRQAVDSISKYMISAVPSTHSAYLEQNIPNPAANSTTIGFRLPEDARRAKMELFELTTGRILKSVGIPATGKGQVEINLSQLAAGIYGYRLIAEGSVLGTKKLIVIKQ